MTEETATAVETTQELEVTETTQETKPTVTEETASATEEAASVAEETTAPSLDLSDLYAEQEVETQQKAEPDYSEVVDDIAKKVAAMLKSQESIEHQEPADNTYSPEKITRSVLEEVQRQKNAEQIIIQNIQESANITQKYVAKMQNAGIDINNNPALKNSAELLFRQMKIDMATQLKRNLINPFTGQIDPVLSPKETAHLINNHWKVFSETYLGGIKPTKPVSTNGLSAANQASGTTAEVKKDAPDEMTIFRQKRDQGTLTKEDVINTMLRTSQKK